MEHADHSRPVFPCPNRSECVLVCVCARVRVFVSVSAGLNVGLVSVSVHSAHRVEERSEFLSSVWMRKQAAC